MNLTAPPCDNDESRAAILRMRRSHLVPISVLQVCAFADHPTPARRATCLLHSRSPGGLLYGTLRRDGGRCSPTLRGYLMRTLVLAAVTVFLACDGAFAQPLAIHNPQSMKPPTFDGGGPRPRAFNVQNGAMWNYLYGGTYRPQTGIYYNPRPGVTCTGNAALVTCF